MSASHVDTDLCSDSEIVWRVYRELACYNSAECEFNCILLQPDSDHVSCKDVKATCERWGETIFKPKGSKGKCV